MLDKDRTTCPAVMFAARRNDSVSGRTRTLVVSIITRNGFSHSGAPSGRRWAVVCLGENIALEMIILAHIGNPIDSVIKRWLDSLNIYGDIPKRLVKMININRDETIKDSPFKLIIYVRESWEKIVEIIGDLNELIRLVGSGLIIGRKIIIIVKTERGIIKYKGI